MEEVEFGKVGMDEGSIADKKKTIQSTDTEAEASIETEVLKWIMYP